MYFPTPFLVHIFDKCFVVKVKHIMKEKISPASAILYTKFLLEKTEKLYDSISSSYYKCPHPDLVTINNLIVDEFEQIYSLLDSNISSYIFEIVYKKFDFDNIYNSWKKDKEAKLYRLKMLIELSYPKMDFSLPHECMYLLGLIDKKIDTYTMAKHKFNADTMALYIRAEKQKKEEKLNNLPERYFNFITDNDLRLLLISFYNELRNAYLTDTVRTSIVLVGSIIEALLKESLKLEQQKAIEKYKQIEKDNKKFDEWNFNTVIKVSFALNILPVGLRTQVDTIRNFRNFIHVHKAIKQPGLQFDNNYKEICIKTLNIVINHVREWFELDERRKKTPTSHSTR